MELKIEASQEELEQIAKMAYIAMYVVDSSGKFSTGYKYPDMELFNSALRQLSIGLYFLPFHRLAYPKPMNKAKKFLHTPLN